MIAIRPILVLGLGFLAVLMVMFSPPALAASTPADDLDLKSVVRPALDLRLAQATGSDQRGPRQLGAVPSSVQVPSLQCLSTDAAEVTLRQRQLRLGQVHQRPSTACPDGGVVAQSPPRGTTVRPGTAIEVIVATTTGGSSGSAGSTIPDLEGLTPAEAQNLLRREGLQIGQISRESAAAPLGTIVRQQPAAGSPSSVGRRVNITVAAEVRVPDLRRLSRADAIQRLEEASLALGRVTEENSTQPNGSVIKQWPLPGVPAAAEDKVDITIAKGQFVPDLGRLSLDEARRRLQAAGLQPGSVENRPSDQPGGTIIDQRPAANTSVRPGAAVDLVIAAAPVVPNLVGRTVDQSRQLLLAQRLEVGSITSKVSPEPQGTVLEQRPSANTEARPRSKVDLVLAEGLETPTLVGLTLKEAGAELAKKLMRLGDVERQVASDGDNRIVQQNPAAGTSASLGIAIDVVVRVPPTVPNLLGLSQDDVASRLAEQQLSLSEVGYQLAPGTPSQTVISQNPEPGTNIANGQAVEIVLAVSEAPADRPDLVAVPTLSNLSLSQADQNLKLAGLELQLDGTPDDTRPHRVTAQNPSPGRFIQVGAPVVALVEPVDKAVVPDLLGINQDSADPLLTDSFLTIGERTWALSTKEQGTIIDQEPAPGTEVALGLPVDLVLSASALIPDLTGLTPEEATPILGGMALQLGGIEEVFSFRWPGTIVAQTPPPDSPTGGDSIVRVEVVSMVGPLTVGGSLLLALAGFIFVKTRQSGHGSAPQTAAPPPVYGIAKSGTVARPAFSRTAKAARPGPVPPPQQREPNYIVNTDAGTQVIQTDASTLVKPSIRLRGRADQGEQSLAIESS